MAELTTAQKAPLLLDGQPIAVGGPVNIGSSDASVASITSVNTFDGDFIYVVAQGPGTTTITVTKGGQTGTLELTVVVAPLVVTLGTPEPK